MMIKSCLIIVEVHNSSSHQERYIDLLDVSLTKNKKKTNICVNQNLTHMNDEDCEYLLLRRVVDHHR